MASLNHKFCVSERDIFSRDELDSSGKTGGGFWFARPAAAATLQRRKPTCFRNSLDLKDRVQVKVLRRRLKLSGEQFSSIVRKSGSSISAITKEAATLR
jgi:hypothetical protein